MSLRILVVDDSSAMRALLKKILSTCGLPIDHVFEAADGLEGLASLRNNPVNLILSDINLPGGDGASPPRDIRRDPELKSRQFVFLSGGADSVPLRNGVEEGRRRFPGQAAQSPGAAELDEGAVQ